MEKAMMSVVFSSIRSCPAIDTEVGTGKLAASGPEVQAQQSGHALQMATSNDDAYVEKTSQEVFASLVNAKSCANSKEGHLPDCYMTLMHQGSLIRGYLY